MDHLLPSFQVPLRSHMANTLESHQHKVIGQFPNVSCILWPIISLSCEPWAKVSCCGKLKFMSDQVNPKQSSAGWNCWVTISRVHNDLIFVERNQLLVNAVAPSQWSIVKEIIIGIAHWVILDESRNRHVSSDVLVQKKFVNAQWINTWRSPWQSFVLTSSFS